ncbi:hypothetical protein H7U19_06945 [Hyunsoonleella sp. SJ7]|uniref:Outer membrane lipoprotein-sorting protein n=2 Tax=Hyunsoonleella aquatilis TaxID=2762758 RepID=A0A923H8G1_9FLAO|nr:DUF6503 family protein [Hyunsoonleella aquatilis]MBC3758133.1 hypothetical protein [Hyunsoonleella aquatilis]
MKQFFLLVTLVLSSIVFSQNMTGEQLLEKAIAYHDPNGNWNSFKGELNITMEIPEKPNRDSEILIDLPGQYFSMTSKVENDATKYFIRKDSITVIFNSDKSPSDPIIKKHKKRAQFFKNYYTYLYGLPMKLKDPGTIIHNEVQSKIFKGEPYWVLKATYEASVGKDIWYFYFNKENYAMEVYQFFRDESKNDGEYILLTEEETINGIKMPKVRAWFMNKDDKYLGTDILKSPGQP